MAGLGKCGGGTGGGLRLLRAGTKGRFRRELHQGGEAQAASAEAKVAEAEGLHDRVVNGHAHEDYVGAVLRQAADGFALLEGQAPEPFKVPGNARRSEASRLDAGAVERFETCLHAPEDGGSAAYTDKLHCA